MDPASLRDELARLASNLAWSWSPSSRALLDSLPGAHPGTHPASTVADLDDDQLAALAADGDLVAAVAAATDRLAALGTVTEPEIAYFSPEFGIAEEVPQYSGGLGILAGDHLKAASDEHLDLAGVGLFYRQGFFRQRVDGNAQRERYETYDPADFGAADTGATVEVPVGARSVVCKVWRLDVGAVPLILLDTDHDANHRADRTITDRLYSGDRRHRIRQEMILGVGGARALAHLGWAPPVHHLNEGHAGFLILELIDRRLAAGATDLDEAVADITDGLVFTTHTPVPAGIDRFARSLAAEHLRPWASRWNVPIESLLALGAEGPSGDAKTFNMANLCLRVAGRANGVSRLHGEVSRKLFAEIPGGDAIGHITNGVHARTWVHPPLQDLFDAELGERWAAGDPDAWVNAADLDDATVAAARATGRAALVAMVADRTGVTLDPDALTIGFARRFATYKRADLILRELDRLTALLADDDRPVQFVFAGKAHPADDEGKALLARIVDFAASDAASGRFVFVPDYDIAVAQAMYAGCDVWLNNPIRPHEASGTSGEKSALNGGLNCSISDGWWAEMADDRNGWTIPSSTATVAARRDAAEARSVLDLLEHDIVPLFHADGPGPSAGWLDRVRHCWQTLGPKVTAARMVRDYHHGLYLPAAESSRP